jgi:glucuronoarabinoxylan endo-1,4-beta-xylanase
MGPIKIESASKCICIYSLVYEAILIMIFFAGFLVSTVNGLTITIDPNIKYQTMIGLGGAACNNENVQFIPDIVNDAGMSAARFDWCDPNPVVAQFINAGCRTLVGSCWSPPANMKDNNSLISGGHLLASQQDAFANLAIQKLQEFKTKYGFELFALSPQNEPRFAEPYNSCIYGPDLIQVAKLIGQKIKAAGLKTKIFLPEDVFEQWTGETKANYLTPLISDTAACKFVSALAFHGYGSNGVTPAQMSATGLMGFGNYARVHGWELWQTENAGSFGMAYAHDVIACLRYGKCSLFLKFCVVSNQAGYMGDVNEFFITGGQKTSTYQIAKCINKFIRPGSIQLRSISSDSATFCNFVTFYDPTAKALVITLATRGTAQNISLQGTNLPATFQKWVAGPAMVCANQGDAAVSSTISIPANTVMTLYATGYSLPTQVKSPFTALSITRVHAGTG